MHDRSYTPNNCRVQNVYYEKDIHYVLQVCKWFLKPIGIWPLIYSYTSKRERLLSAALITTCFSTLCFIVVPSSYYVLFEEKDINVRIKLLGPIGFGVISVIKYCFLGLKGPAFGRCIEHIQKDWKMLGEQEHRSIMIRHVSIGRNLTTLCAIFFYTGGLSYHTAVPLLSHKKINGNITFRPLTYPGYDVFLDSQSSPTYEILFCTHCFYALITYNITTAECSLAAIFTTHACGQIQIQMSRLEDLIEGMNFKGKSFNDSLAVIVRDHAAILRFSRNLQEVLREICLMEIVASTLLICIVEYYCMMEWKNSDAIAISTYCTLFISFTFNILIFCYIGELLAEQATKIGAASYEIEWYKLPERKALDLILLMAVSRYPCKLTAGKMFDLSLKTFGAVLKSSLMYLNILRTVTE